MKITYCVISHTHWDREWSLPFENVRLRLVDMMDNLLDILEKEPEFRFHLDAQTIVLEDYLAIKPENRKLLEQHIRSGRILAGPWYVQNDFFLTSGEATIRNLMLGMEMAEEYGACMRIGYAPDQFGNISQLPQLLRGFGMDNCVFGRGYNFDEPRKTEFYWKSPDGSRVLAIHMAYWYNNAQRFPENPDRSLRLVQKIKQDYAGVATTPYYLLMNGVDILEAQENLMPILKKLRERLPEDETILQCTLPQYLQWIKDSVGELDEFCGELRYGHELYILTGTLSSRVYLKQQNTSCQSLLENRLEPLYSLLHMLGTAEYPAHHLRYLWKQLLQNHPHDDICGCSCDSVHEDMMHRFKGIRELGNELLERAMQFVSEYTAQNGVGEDQYRVTVFNTGLQERNGLVELDVDFLSRDQIEGFGLYDEEGNPVPFQVLGKRNKTRGVMTPINLPGVLDYTSYHTKIRVDKIEGMSYRTLTVKPEAPAVQVPAIHGSSGCQLENEFLKVTVHQNGTIDLFHRETGITYQNLLVLEDREDTGDSYVYRNNTSLDSIFSIGSTAEIQILEKHDLGTVCRIAYSLCLPESYDREAGSRSNRMQEVSVELLLSLEKGSRQLAVTITIDNRVKDHRMRVLFPTGIPTPVSMAGSPFDVILRDRRWVDQGILKVAQQPNTGFIYVDGEGYGLSVFNKGLYEYEMLPDCDGTLALTLLRGNGYIAGSESDIPMEESWQVPGNQCQGQYTLELALYPYAGDGTAAGVVGKAAEWQNPLFAAYHPVDPRKFVGGRAFVQDSEINEVFFREKKYPDLKLPPRLQFMQFKGDPMALSCLKKKEKGDSVVVRLYNPTDRESRFELKLLKTPAEAYRTNLREERIQSLEIKPDGFIPVCAGPKEIVTLEIVDES